MKERPILMNGAMVRATLADIKTQTRRILKKQPYESLSNPPQFSDTMPGDLFVCPDHFPTDTPGRVITECEKIGVYHCMGQKEFAEKHSPYGQPGDRFWVRETYYAFGRWETRFSAKKKRDEWHFIDMTRDMDRLYQFGTESIEPCLRARDPGILPTWWKRPSIFMPRAACRILLEIVSVRVERLQGISEQDAIAEGAMFWAHEQETQVKDTSDARHAFMDLWQSINGPGSWDANPWVWVVEFRRIKQ